MKRYKTAVGVLMLIATLVAFIYYLHGHRSLLSQLRYLSILTFAFIVAMYSVMMVFLIVVYDTTVRLCKASVPIKEHTLLTLYSTIINFFGPLQSGPGVRLVYLKQRFGVSMKTYALITLVYYAMFAYFSGLFLLMGSPTLLLFAILLSLMALAFLWRLGRHHMRWLELTNKNHLLVLILRMAGATLMQVVLTGVIYFTELKTVDRHISLQQAAIYTGAANFALFVSLTPGALGFRESFLLLSRRLHHISVSNVVLANVIDRSVYIAFLGLLVLIVIVVHGKDRLQLKSSGKPDKDILRS